MSGIKWILRNEVGLTWGLYLANCLRIYSDVKFFPSFGVGNYPELCRSTLDKGCVLPRALIPRGLSSQLAHITLLIFQ